MLGVSFTELLLVGMVALVVVGPSRLPKLLGTLGRWSAKLRRITTEVRHQSGIDELLRKEGISGGLNELRQLRSTARSGLTGLLTPGASTPARPSARPAAAGSAAASGEDPYADVPYDRSREYPVEGCDAAGALPDDLWRDPTAPVAPPAAPVGTPAVSQSTATDPVAATPPASPTAAAPAVVPSPAEAPSPSPDPAQAAVPPDTTP